MSELKPMTVLIVEDQALVAMQLQLLVEDAGHTVLGWATDLAEASALLAESSADLALVDIHLADGPTGTQLAADLSQRDIPVVFMTANAKRVPEDFVGAIGILAKPYTANSVTAALEYLHLGVLDPPPSVAMPAGLQLSPAYAEMWAVA